VTADGQLQLSGGKQALARVETRSDGRRYVRALFFLVEY
jgi:hypothetical protein